MKNKRERDSMSFFVAAGFDPGLVEFWNAFCPTFFGPNEARAAPGVGTAMRATSTWNVRECSRDSILAQKAEIGTQADSKGHTGRGEQAKCWS